MPTPEIIQKVKDLHQQLRETPDVPAPAQPAVSTIQQQIDTIMLDPTQVAHYTSLNDRLLFAYVKLESEHPKLAQAMVDLTNRLAAAGL